VVHRFAGHLAAEASDAPGLVVKEPHLLRHIVKPLFSVQILPCLNR
jgi:hypothetical protein